MASLRSLVVGLHQRFVRPLGFVNNDLVCFYETELAPKVRIRPASALREVHRDATDDSVRTDQHRPRNIRYRVCEDELRVTLYTGQAVLYELSSVAPHYPGVLVLSRL